MTVALSEIQEEMRTETSRRDEEGSESDRSDTLNLTSRDLGHGDRSCKISRSFGASRKTIQKSGGKSGFSGYSAPDS